MRTRRLLGASTTLALAVGLVGAATPTAVAGDNDKADWDGKRVAQFPGHTDGAVHVIANRGKMTTVVRELGAGTDQWRIRESRDGGLGFKPRLEGPRDVSRFRYDQSGMLGTTYAAWESGGVLQAGEADATRSIRLTPTSPPGGLGPAATEAPKVVAGESNKDLALVTQGGTWHQHTGPVGGPSETDPQDNPTGPGWVSYPDPNLDGTPGNAGEDYAFAESGHLLTFWNAANGDLTVARRDAQNTAAPFGAARVVAPGERYVDFVETAQGGRLVTQATDGSVVTYAYLSTGPDDYSFTGRRVLGGPLADAPEPQVVVDGLGTVTIGWKETQVEGGGLKLWQVDRPASTYLERPTFVTGTRDTSGWQIVASPKGSLTVAFRRANENAIVRVKHLPAGKTKWTDGVRLVSPKPITDSSAAWALGAPNNDQDSRVVVNDKVGVYGFRFDAPRPYTKVTKPVRKVQKSKTYRIRANTSWTFADSWHVRMRLDKGKRYGAWKVVAMPEGDNDRLVTRARGKTWCYQAKAFFHERQVTRWSSQRCVTVRR
jgi:hypothetical protein